MLRAGACGRRILHCSALGLATIVGVASVSADANARARRQHQAAAESYEPSYASIVVDANSGAVMQQTSADSPRHPASLTKIMTLYLLFERLEAGKIKLNTEMSVSAHAAEQAPSKLGLKPGETIDVETAIRAVVTKSANDVAVVIAETIGGSEESFARAMTAKARALGMDHTTYRNASGLPDDQQITTARDQALLGRAIQDRFPQQYRYFSTRMFQFAGKLMRNHNHLLGNVEGVDGIKTGYIHDSGFNIVTSVRRGNRHIVAVVFGGRTAEARDARMMSLIANNINVASLKRTAPMIAEGGEKSEPRAPERVATAAPAAATGPAQGSTEPIKPNAVKTFNVKAGTLQTASLSAVPLPAQRLTPAPAAANPATVTTINTVKNEPAAMPLSVGARPGVLGVLPARAAPAQVASAGDSVPVAVTASTETSAKARGGWMIQVGAFDDENDAKQRLTIAQSKAKDQLGDADPFTERAAKGDKALFRARFAGLEKDKAESACKTLKHSEIPCMLLKK